VGSPCMVFGGRCTQLVAEGRYGCCDWGEGLKACTVVCPVRPERVESP
jgi:hypothetical protein